MLYVEFYYLIDQIIDESPGTVTGKSALGELPAWDSLAVLSFMAMLDEQFQVAVSGKQIAACETVDDLAKFVADRLSF
jgi:acyl carrier protein